MTIRHEMSLLLSIFILFNLVLSSIALTPNEVQLVLKSLLMGKASGPIRINNRILKELANEIFLPLVLSNLSLQTGTVPESYKEGNVCSILKKDDPSLPSNYRPTTLLNSEDKVFERLVFKHLYNHLRDNNILTSLQSGFIPGDSTYLYNTKSQPKKAQTYSVLQNMHQFDSSISF